MKHIIASGLFAMPALVAAQTGSLTITGNINAQFESISAPGATNPLAPADALRVTGRTRANQNASELRFSGSRAFGNGIEGFFTLGSEVQSFSGAHANNTGTFAARNTGVGLRGRFGEVALGRWDSHYHWGSIFVDRAFIHQGLATDSKGLLSFVNGSVFVGSRFSNSLTYSSPNFGGLVGRVVYSRNDGGVAAGGSLGPLKDSSINLAATYQSGPVSAFASYFRREDASVPLPFAAAATATAMDQDGVRVGASYAFGGLTVGAIVDSTKQVHRTSPVASVDMTRTAWVIPVRYELGPHRMAASYGVAQDSRGSLMPASVVGTNNRTGASFMQLSYQYWFDKSANINVAYARMRNRANGMYDLTLQGGLGINGLPATRGADPRTIQVGMYFGF